MKKNCFIIEGGKQLIGDVKVQASKNATLPIISACLLANGTTILKNYPKISDLDNMLKIIKKLGATVKITENYLEIETSNIISSYVDEKLSKTMRSSIFLLGSLLSRFKTARVTLPGGCNIGERPIDLHISAFKKLGVKVSRIDNHIFFNAANAKSAKIKLKIPSVGATENIIQFCALLKGKTTIINAAKEPEIIDLCNFLNKMGAKIVGAGTNKIEIYGVNKLKSTSYMPSGDRIVAGTIAIAVAMCGGDVVISNTNPIHNLNLIKKLSAMGCQITTKNDIIHIKSDGNLISLKHFKTGYFPHFPTDLQSLLLVASCVSHGETKIVETVFENRFLIIDEINKMGARIKKINNKKVIIGGVEKLKPAEVVSKDLRGGAALILAGLVANGKTIVKNIKYIDRGYENIEQVFNKLGANIRRE